MSAIVSLSKVSKSYTRGKQEVVVLRDLDSASGRRFRG
jgi:hypothetical protein